MTTIICNDNDLFKAVERVLAILPSEGLTMIQATAGGELQAAAGGELQAAAGGELQATAGAGEAEAVPSEGPTIEMRAAPAEVLGELRFVDYPCFDVRLEGDRYYGGIPARMIPALTNLQKALDVTAKQLLGVPELDSDMLHRIELVVHTGQGSLSLFTGFSEALTELVEATTKIVEATTKLVEATTKLVEATTKLVEATDVRELPPSHKVLVLLGLALILSMPPEIIEAIVVGSNAELFERLEPALGPDRAKTVEQLVRRCSELGPAIAYVRDTYQGILSQVKSGEQLFVSGIPVFKKPKQ